MERFKADNIAAGRGKKEYQGKLRDLREGHARLEKLVSRSRTSGKPAGKGGKKWKLNECDQLIDLAQVVVRDPGSRIILWTRGDEKLYGFAKTEAMGQVSHALLKTLFPVSREAVDQELEKKGSWQGELTHTTRDGRKITVASHQVLYREGGKPVAILEVNNDITAFKQTEHRLRESEANLARAQQISHIGNWTWDLQDNQIWCSDEFYRVFGLPNQDYFTYGQFLAMLRGEDRDRVDRAVQAAVAGKQPYFIEYRIVRPDGEERYVHAEGSIIQDPSGRPVKFFGVVQDITEQRRADLILADQATRLQEQARVIDLAHILIRDPESRIILWTSGDQNLYGYSKEEALGRVSHELFKTVFPVSREAFEQGLEKNGRWQGELIHTAKDGHKVVVASHQVLYKEHGQTLAILEVNNDITEQNRIYTELLESQQLLARSQEMAHLGSWIWYIPSDRQVWSDERYRIFGLKPGEAPPDFHTYLSYIHQEDRQAVEKAIQRSLRDSTPFDAEYRIVRKDGTIRYIHSEANLSFDRDHKPVKMFGIGQDITERKQAELKIREAKNQSDLYLDIMGHDINNLNQIALSNLDLLKEDENLTEDQKETITDALSSVRGSAAIIDNVRKIQAITRERLSMQAEDLDEMLRECIAQAPKPAGYTATIHYEPRPGCLILGTALMKEIFCNLINNSIKHAGRDVTIDIRLEDKLRAGKKFYDVAIADNGPGIPDSLKSKLFARFQRGDTRAHGKGLGLFIVKSLVEQAGGNVTIEDTVPGDYSAGARFVVSLPAWEGEH